MRSGSSQFTRRTSQSWLLILVQLRTDCFDLLFDEKTLGAAEESANRTCESALSIHPEKIAERFTCLPSVLFLPQLAEGRSAAMGLRLHQSFS